VVSVVSNAMVKFDSRNQPIRRASVSLDRESNSIVVSGSRQDLKDAEGIIQRLDNEGSEGSGGTVGNSKNRTLKMVEVVGEPDTLAQVATRVFLAQNAGRSVTNLVSITPEPNGRRLIVLAPDSLMAQVETVISALDARPDQSQRQLHTIEPQGSRAADLLPMVNKIYAEQNQGRTTKPATLYTDPSGDRLMVFGTADQAAVVRDAIENARRDSFPEVLALVRSGGALDAARQHGIAEATAAKHALQRLPDSKFKETLLQFADFAVQRSF
jgi:type II secretory pathway component GspD/PulD (secretin)